MIVAAEIMISIAQIYSYVARTVATSFLLATRYVPQVFTSRTIEYTAQTAKMEPNIAEQMDDWLAQIGYHLPETGPKTIVHPNVYERIGYGVTHGQIVRHEPNVHDTLVFPYVWPHVANYN